MTKMLTASMLRRLGNDPRVHGNGFIQLDLNSEIRMHVWGDPRIPRQEVATPIHDHVFSFRSKCVMGHLVHQPYSVHWDDRGEYVAWAAVPGVGDDSKLVRADERRVRIKALDPTHLLTGGSYVFEAFKFHETLVEEPTITLMYKGGPTLAQKPDGWRPRVLVPHDAEPDNSFDRHGHDLELLWQIIGDTLGE